MSVKIPCLAVIVFAVPVVAVQADDETSLGVGALVFLDTSGDLAEKYSRINGSIRKR